MRVINLPEWFFSKNRTGSPAVLVAIKERNCANTFSAYLPENHVVAKASGDNETVSAPNSSYTRHTSALLFPVPVHAPAPVAVAASTVWPKTCAK